MLPNFRESKSSRLSRSSTIVPLAPFRLNQRVVKILQISTPPRINKQLVKLKNPYFWPQKSGYWWCSSGDREPKRFKVSLVPFRLQLQRLGKSSSSRIPYERQRGHRVHLTRKPLDRAGRPSKLTVKSQSLPLFPRNSASLSPNSLFSYTGSWQSFDVTEQLISANQYLASKIWARSSHSIPSPRPLETLLKWHSLFPNSIYWCLLWLAIIRFIF